MKIRIPKISISQNALLVTYKLLHDLLFLLLVTFAAILAADGLVPALLISTRLSFSKIATMIILSFSAIVYLGKKLDIAHHPTKINKSKILPALILFSFLLIGNSLLKFSFWENIVITLTTLFIFFLFFELLFSPEE